MGAAWAVAALLIGGCEAEADPEMIRSQCLASAEAAPPTYLLGASWEPSACSRGICGRGLKLESTCVTFQAVDADGQLVQLNLGTLTEAGAARATALATALIGVALPPAYESCEGSCDAGMVAIEREGAVTLHEFIGGPDPALAAAHEFLAAIRDSLARCERSSLVRVAEGCAEAPR